MRVWSEIVNSKQPYTLAQAFALYYLSRFATAHSTNKEVISNFMDIPEGGSIIARLPDEALRAFGAEAIRRFKRKFEAKKAYDAAVTHEYETERRHMEELAKEKLRKAAAAAAGRSRKGKGLASKMLRD